MADQVDSAAIAPPASEAAAPSAERHLVLWLTNLSHAVNHFQGQMVSVLYAVIMPDFGFGYTQLGIITAITGVIGALSQGLYGLATPFLRRAGLLGVGNLIMGVGTCLTGLTGSFSGFVGARAVAQVGGSAQHPIGASLLARYFPRRRGAVLAFNSSVAQVGSILAPIGAGLLLLVMSWRQVFLIVGFLSLAIGLAYLLAQSRLHDGHNAREGSGKFGRAVTSYLQVLRNRNVLLVCLVMMVGGAGRGAGVNLAYIGPHLKNDLGLTTTLVAGALTALQAGGMAGAIILGWLSDRLSRKGIIQVSLLLSGLGTLWIAFQGASLIPLFVGLVIYGGVTSSRLTLTQAVVADSLPDNDRDAGFSIFFLLGFTTGPLWALLTGILMDHYGFSIAFSTLAVTYVIGITLMFFVVDSRPKDRGRAVAEPEMSPPAHRTLP